jgi:hypothetical protein
MVTRQQRIDAFVHEGDPSMDQLLEILCEDNVGTYVFRSSADGPAMIGKARPPASVFKPR